MAHEILYHDINDNNNHNNNNTYFGLGRDNVQRQTKRNFNTLMDEII